MKLGVTATLAALALVGASPANAHLVTKPKDKTLDSRIQSQQHNLAHSRYVCNRGANYYKRWHCAAAKWLQRELNQSLAAKPHSLRLTLERDNPCLAEIIDRETAGTWDHTIWNYQGSGAYGLPQALPAHKMASAGSDYMTNPHTQIRWMIGYVNERYGGSCQALAFHNRNGYY